MENASKALLIAGAILLSILLISLGIMIYNNAKGTINNASLDAEDIQVFNSKLTQYCGTNKKASTVNDLVQVIIAINNAQNGKANSHKVQFRYRLKNGPWYPVTWDRNRKCTNNG